MQFQTTIALGLLALAGQVVSAPNPLPHGIEERQASCVFSGTEGAAKVKAGKTSCTTITLSNLVVPAGTTLDLTGLNKGTKVGILITWCSSQFSHSSPGYFPRNHGFQAY